MSKVSTPRSRKCTAVNQDGRRCRAWAVRESEPPQCSAHGGYSVGAGAPEGNRNALKHGYYARGLRPEELEVIDLYKARSLQGELVLARVMVMRLVDYLKAESRTAAEMCAVMKYVFIGLRTIAHLEERLGDWDEGIWEEALAALKEKHA